MKIRFKVQATPATQQRQQQQPHQRETQQAPTLDFVNIDKPGQIKDQATQRRIRRHVMRDVSRARQRIAAGQDIDPYQIALFSKAQYWCDFEACPSFERLFRSMDVVSEGLLTIVFSDSAFVLWDREYVNFADARDKLPLAEDAFIKQISQYTESVGLVRKSIHSQASRYAVIGTIICLSYIDLRCGKMEKWDMHLQGLHKLLELGGGVDELNSCPAIRQSLFLADVLGSLINDARPRFLLPPHCPALHTGYRPVCYTELLQQASFTASSLDDRMSLATMESSLISASQLAILLNQIRSQVLTALDLLQPVCMIAHNVLSLPGSRQGGSYERYGIATTHLSSVCAIGELVRLSVLTLLSIVIATTSGDTLYLTRQRDRPIRQLLMRTDDSNWTSCGELRLWVLVIQSLIEKRSVRNWFLDEIVRVMSLLSLSSWNDMVSALHKVMWIERVAIKEMARLKLDVESRLTPSPG